MDTYWESQDRTIKVTLKEVIKELDKQAIPVLEIEIDKLKPIIIDNDYLKESRHRVAKADLSYPIIVIVKNGKYKSILDGNHRAFKAWFTRTPTIKVREINLDCKNTPQIYKDLFDYNIKPLL